MHVQSGSMVADRVYTRTQERLKALPLSECRLTTLPRQNRLQAVVHAQMLKLCSSHCFLQAYHAKGPVKSLTPLRFARRDLLEEQVDIPVQDQIRNKKPLE